MDSHEEQLKDAQKILTEMMRSLTNMSTPLTEPFMLKSQDDLSRFMSARPIATNNDTRVQLRTTQTEW